MKYEVVYEYKGETYVNSSAISANDLAARSSIEVQVGERNISVSDKIADSIKPAVCLEIGTPLS